MAAAISTRPNAASRSKTTAQTRRRTATTSKTRNSAAARYRAGRCGSALMALVFTRQAAGVSSDRSANALEPIGDLVDDSAAPDAALEAAEEAAERVHAHAERQTHQRRASLGRLDRDEVDA